MTDIEIGKMLNAVDDGMILINMFELYSPQSKVDADKLCNDLFSMGLLDKLKQLETDCRLYRHFRKCDIEAAKPDRLRGIIEKTEKDCFFEFNPESYLHKDKYKQTVKAVEMLTIKEALMECKSLIGCATIAFRVLLGYPANTQGEQIQLPESLLRCLQENGFIEKADVRPLKWLKTKQHARELLTHPKIKGNLLNAEVERQTLNIFIYHKDGKPLKLAKNKPTPNHDSDKLINYLATL